jgi:UDPglucose 6-dehydrogenase
MREAASLVLIDLFLKAGAVVVAYDPIAMNEAQKHVGNKISYSDTPYEALRNADALLLITEWKEFQLPD